MYKLNKKKKIVTSIILLIIVSIFSYYVYSNNRENSLEISNLEVENENNSQLEDSIQDSEKQNTENQNAEEKKKENVNNENKVQQPNAEENKIDQDNQEKIKVHISGAVNNEGIIELNSQSRIADAIEKAGGLKEDACIAPINLAYILEDGMKIHIPSNEEIEQEKNNLQNMQAIEENTQKYISTASGIDVENAQEKNENNSNNQSKQLPTTKININTATQTQLETLPGIGPSTALKIINYRTENGKFKTIEQIQEVSGIGENKFNKIKEYICI